MLLYFPINIYPPEPSQTFIYWSASLCRNTLHNSTMLLMRQNKICISIYLIYFKCWVNVVIFCLFYDCCNIVLLTITAFTRHFKNKRYIKGNYRCGYLPPRRVITTFLFVFVVFVFMNMLNLKVRNVDSQSMKTFKISNSCQITMKMYHRLLILYSKKTNSSTNYKYL